MYVPALRLPPVGLLAEEKAKEDPPVPTPPNPGPPPKPVGESDMEVSFGLSTQATQGKNERSSASGIRAGISKQTHYAKQMPQPKNWSTTHSLTSDKRLQNTTVFTVHCMAKQGPKGEKQTRGILHQSHQLQENTNLMCVQTTCSHTAKILWTKLFLHKTWWLFFLGQISPVSYHPNLDSTVTSCGKGLLSFLVVWTHKETDKLWLHHTLRHIHAA